MSFLSMKAVGYLSLGLKVFSTTAPVMTFLIFAVLIAVLIVLAVRAVRRYNFNFRGSED